MTRYNYRSERNTAATICYWLAFSLTLILANPPLGLATPTRDFFTVNEQDDGGRAAYDLENIDENHTGRVLKWIRENRLEMALADCKYTLERFPNHPRALVLLESVARLLEVPAIPMPYYIKALSIYPQHALTHAQYGKYLIGVDDLDGAIASLKKSEALDASISATHVWLAEAYSKKGNVELASQEMNKAKALGYKGGFVGEASANHKQ